MEKRYGYSIAQWNQAREEMRDVLISVAMRGDKEGYITYSDLVDRVSTIRFELPSYALNEMLGEIALAEFKAGRGLLTAIVVYKDALQPGPGWYAIAKYAGIDISTQQKRVDLWIDQLKLIHDYWSQHAVRTSPLGRKRIARSDGRPASTQ